MSEGKTFFYLYALINFILLGAGMGVISLMEYWFPHLPPGASVGIGVAVSLAVAYILTRAFLIIRQLIIEEDVLDE
ncbi:MAG: hypothetical protein D6681_18695 [Calditrichaeota bacterium]|nr:MAG: hypothetical protein D6681_18695 [Calditrichota bacterium]